MGMFENVEAVFFDIDGTLVDVFPFHLESYRRAFKTVTGIDINDRNFFPPLWRLGVDRTVWKRTLELHNMEPAPQTIQALLEARAAILPRLLQKASRKNVLPGIIALLSRLQKNGKKLVAFSGNVRSNGEAILKRTGLAKFFGQTFFSSDSPAIHSKEELLRFIVRQTRIQPKKAVVVADSIQDMVAARQNRLNAIGVATGFHSFRELKEVGYGSAVKRLGTKPSKPKQKPVARRRTR